MIGPAAPRHRGHGDDQVGRNVMRSIGGSEFTGVGAVYAPLRYLPAGLRLVVLMVALMIAMVGCSIAWVDHQSYIPSPNICAPGQEARTDCVHVQRVAPTAQVAQR